MIRAAALIPILLLVAALAPFGLGVLLARASGFPAERPVLILEGLAVVALFLASLAAREAYAPEVGRWPRGTGLDRETWERLAYAGLIAAGGLAVVLQWGWQTGDFTLPLAGLGVLAGYFIFAPPLAWARRGWGEFWGGLCFGLLPVASGYYLQSQYVISEILLYGLPLSLAAFNLLLVLGFPAPGQAAGPNSGTLAVRLGPVGAALLYTIVNILVVLGLLVALFFPAARQFAQPWLWALIVLALVNQELVKRRAYYNEARLQLVCFLTLGLHLGMCLIFGLGLWGRL
jgi:1,4-dihydroxy-2-naphthoate polyprenyltransferase